MVVNSKDYDFAGWATKNDLKCADGRIIRHNAFVSDDGCEVPLVWNHKHDGPGNVLGHALLENRPEGVYAYCKFNNNAKALEAKEAVKNGDIKSLSIFANKLIHKGCDVVHGAIKEVSLVIAGANPGAFIEDVIAHSELENGESAVIYPGSEDLCFFHSDERKEEKEMPDSTKAKNAETDKTVEDVFNTLTEEQKNVVYALIGQAIKDAKAEMKHSDEDAIENVISDDIESTDVNEDDTLEHSSESDKKEKSEKTIEDVFNSFTEEQKNVVYALIAQALEDAKNDKNNDSKEEKEMKHNAFEGTNDQTMNTTLSHADVAEIIGDAKKYGSMKESVLAHAAEYGIENIDYLFPDAKTLENTPEFIKREDSWVTDVLASTHHTPFARIKSLFADVTEEDARAKGYIKGNLKKDEVFTLLKRITTPTTIYKHQKLDRDDIVDITDFNVVAWLKQEMRMMLNEEIARAILVGDGRSTSSNDKINEINIRPIWKDADLFTVKVPVAIAANASDDDKAKAFMKTTIKSRKKYKGSGSPVLYTTEDILTDMLLLEDTTGRKLYDTETAICAALRVKKIVTVPVMEGLTRLGDDGKTYTLAGLVVNLVDYNVGADKGGEINMFDDFDIDYNQQKYLMETRCSGALIKPFSALAIEFVEA